jgi:hypothetical protein
MLLFYLLATFPSLETGGATLVPECLGSPESIRITPFSEVAARLRMDCDDEPRRIIDTRRNVDARSNEQCQVF